MSEAYQAAANQLNPQLWNALGGISQGWNGGLGQAAFGQNLGWQQNAGGWGQNALQQRQLSQQDIGEVVRQLLPILPQVVAQAQQGQAAFGQGYGNQGYGTQGWGNQGGFGGYGQNQGIGHRHLSPQDVNEVVRQILPVIPQIVNLLQQGQQNPYGSAIFGNNQGGGNQGYGNQNPLGHAGWNQQGNPLGQAAFGNFGQNVGQNVGQGFGGFGQQRQLNQHEVGEIVRQLTAALPQVISNLQQTLNQQQRSSI